MKTFLYTFIVFCAFVFALPVSAQKKDKTIITQTVDAAGFSSICMEVVGSIRFTPSETYSVVIEGPAFYVKKLSVEVSKGKLIINTHSKNGNNGNKIKNVVIRISAPTLDKVEIDGVGSFVCEKKLTAKDFKASMSGVGRITIKDLVCKSARLEMDGVGNIDAVVDCKGKLVADCCGVGKITVSGTAGSVSISKSEFVGHVNSKNLRVEDN